MRKMIMMLLLVFSTSLLAFSQSKPKYQAATILDVVPVQTSNDGGTASEVYHISLTLNETVYVVRYVTEEGNSPKYMAGMQLPVLVGEDTIKFNDLIGHSHEVPIVKRRPAATNKAK